MNYNNAHTLAEIIVKLWIGKASEEERERFLSWLDESEANRQTYKNIISGKSILQRLQKEQEIIESVNLEVICKTIAHKISRHRQKRIVAISLSAVAGCVLLLLAGIYWLRDSYNVKSYIVGNATAKVTLITESGNSINLDKNIGDTIDVTSAIILPGDKGIIYKPKSSVLTSDNVEIKNKIITAAGGEFSLTLSDGTKIWLNAMSELEFPVQFNSDQREVILIGEAYFEVAHNKNKPFIVHSLNQSVKVLGTSFNIKAYPEEEVIRTTLLEGKLSVGAGENGVILTPGMESAFYRGNNNIETYNADVDMATAWRSGYFVFNNEDLQIMLNVLSRWYGVAFETPKHRGSAETFSGRFYKYDTIDNILKSITLAGGPEFIIDTDSKVVKIK
jgi:ferric-dicitrate binding protein FerR (iron transport regulator)